MVASTYNGFATYKVPFRPIMPLHCWWSHSWQLVYKKNYLFWCNQYTDYSL